MEIWPATLFPQNDELLSSWLTRIAHNHYQKIYTFYKSVEPVKNARIWSRDIDSTIDEVFLSKLSEHTGITIGRILKTTLKSYEESLFLKKIPNGNTKWILGLGIKNSKIERYGLMYCPGCLRKDKKHPYYRKKWRLSISVCCPDCGCYLKEKCSKCKSPIWFTRSELGKKELMPDKSFTHCYNCGYDLKKSRGSKAEPTIIKYQQLINTYIDQGYTESHNYSHLYFNGLYQILRILNSEREEPLRLKDDISKMLGIQYHYRKKYVYELFEQKRIKERIQLLRIAFFLLENWPINFITICSRNRIWIETLFMVNNNEDELPFWYWEIVTLHLNKRIARHDFKKELERWRQKNKRNSQQLE